METISYEQPREKLAKKGARSLTNAELLQVIIGSGNAQVGVVKIAKKVAKVLEVSGSNVHPQELLAIQGMGKVKAGQILALFELAARFPVISDQGRYSTKDELKSLYQSLARSTKQTVLYATFDGANRLISQRYFIIDKNITMSRQTRKIFADCITDSAASVVIAVGSKNQSLEPELMELNFVRDVYKTSQLLSIPVRLFVLISKEGENSLKEAV